MLDHNIEELADWAGTYLRQLKPSELKLLLKSIGISLRKSTQRRITKQIAPDGSKWPARKNIKNKKKMMLGLRKVKRLKLKTSAQDINLGYSGRDARIARVHQYALKSKPNKKSPSIKYALRVILGLSKQDMQKLSSLLVNHFP